VDQGHVVSSKKSKYDIKREKISQMAQDLVWVFGKGEVMETMEIFEGKS